MHAARTDTSVGAEHEAIIFVAIRPNMVLFGPMDWRSMLCFQTEAPAREITLWLEEDDATERSIRVTVPVPILQEALRACTAVDEGTVKWLGAEESRMGAIRVRDMECVAGALGLRTKISR